MLKINVHRPNRSLVSKTLIETAMIGLSEKQLLCSGRTWYNLVLQKEKRPPSLQVLAVRIHKSAPRAKGQKCLMVRPWRAYRDNVNFMLKSVYSLSSEIVDILLSIIKPLGCRILKETQIFCLLFLWLIVHRFGPFGRCSSRREYL